MRVFLAFLLEVLLASEEFGVFGAKSGESFSIKLSREFWVEEACDLATVE